MLKNLDYRDPYGMSRGNLWHSSQVTWPPHDFCQSSLTSELEWSIINRWEFTVSDLSEILKCRVVGNTLFRNFKFGQRTCQRVTSKLTFSKVAFCADIFEKVSRLRLIRCQWKHKFTIFMWQSRIQENLD